MAKNDKLFDQFVDIIHREWNDDNIVIPYYEETMNLHTELLWDLLTEKQIKKFIGRYK